MDESTIEHWIAGYLRTWSSNDPMDVRALYTEDAEYRTEPWSQPARGAEAIVSLWAERPDSPGSWSFDWSTLAIDGELAIVEGVTRYAAGSTYSNLWLIRLSPDGRATSFTEWWMDQGGSPNRVALSGQ